LRLVVEASAISSEDSQRLSALIQSRQDSADAALGAPDPAAYKSKSGGIVDVLNDLLGDAEAQLEEARKKESNIKHNFDILKMELTDSIKFGNKEMDKTKKNKAALAETSATAQGDLAVVSKDLGESVVQLGDVHHDCMTKAADFELETASRGEELKVLAMAKKIVQEATGGSFAQTYDQPSFLQVGSGSRMRLSTRADLANFEAVKYVRELAKRVNSAALDQLASRMAAAARFGSANGDDPFAKVKGLINEMIEKLLKEAEEEAGKKAYCDKEMGETKAKKDELTTDIEELTTKIDQMSSDAAKLKEEVAILSKELKELASSQAEMDKLRLEEKEAFDANSAEMEKGLEGIKLALKVLREYYAKEAGLLQVAAKEEKQDGAAGGIIAMLEVVESDFSKGLAEMISAEESAVAEYEKVTKENAIAKTTKTQDVKYKSKEAKGLDKAVAEHSTDREGLQTELDAVLEYYAKIKDECIAKPEPYEERKKRREAEIAGLKEALAILDGEAVLLQQSSSRKQTRRLRATA